MYNECKREVLISKILPQSIRDEIARLGYDTIEVEPSGNLTTELRYHPDILRFKLPSGKWLSEANSIQLSDVYPSDCVFNCVVVGKTLVYGNEYIVRCYGDLFERTIRVKQGYVKCSTIVLDDSSVITSDPSIYNKLNGCFNVLKVTNDKILLNGYSCGFIGGTCGVLGKTIAFTGKIEDHPDYENMKAFADNLGFDVYSLSNKPLYDYGGLLTAF